MIVSGTSNRSDSRWLKACVLLCAVVVLPLGIAYAQDYDAVEKRLGEAVSKGELTLEQASAMMAALRKAGGAKKDPKPDRAGEWLMKVRKDLGAAVEAGRISREDAARRCARAERAVRERMAAGARRDEPDWDAIKRRIEGAVKAGKITREEADRHYEGLKRRMAAGRGEAGRKKARKPSREEMGKVKERIWAGVKAGKLTEAQAKERWEGYLKRVRGAGERSDADLEATWKKLQAMVKAGKLTEKEARAKMAAMKKADRPAKETAWSTKKAKRHEGLAGHYGRMGISGEALGRIKKVLADNGIQPKQMEGTLGGAIRVIHEMRSEGEAFELDLRMREYFEKRVGLTARQIEMVQRLARRILHGLRESDRQR